MDRKSEKIIDGQSRKNRSKQSGPQASIPSAYHDSEEKLTVKALFKERVQKQCQQQRKCHTDNRSAIAQYQ